MNPENFPDKITRAQLELMNTFRLLWEQHDVWTRATISSLVFALPDVEPVVARLLRNPEDFEMGLSPFTAGELQLNSRELLQEHLACRRYYYRLQRGAMKKPPKKPRGFGMPMPEAIADF